jgi:hypothetical protein
MKFCTLDDVLKTFRGKRVAIVGSGPGVLENTPGYIDAHDVVVRINNYKLGDAQGRRTDVFYSFFGSSIKKSASDLRRDGVKLCICKCPDSKFMDSEWHRVNNKPLGVDFRYIYLNRARFWFCDTYIPTTEEFLKAFNMLGQRIPTTGFAAILEVLASNPAEAYITGFDFFSSGVHNVDERWRPGDPSDPIGHSPERERRWLRDNLDKHPIKLDPALNRMLEA